MKTQLLCLALCAAAMFGGCGKEGDDICIGTRDDGGVCVANANAPAPTMSGGNKPSANAAADKTDKDGGGTAIECRNASDCQDGFTCSFLGQCVEKTVNPPPPNSNEGGEGDEGEEGEGGEGDESAPDPTPTCVPTGDEVCNGLDDDCDGQVDEDDGLCESGQICVSGSCKCPANKPAFCDACTNTKTDHSNCGDCGGICDADETCQNSKCIGPDDPPPLPEPDPIPPCVKQAEICDGKDNDCDSKIDEADDGTALSRFCGYDGTTPQGECERGSQVCTDGSWGSCTGLISSVAEVCGDSKDNDCNGEIDNGVKNVCDGCGPVPVESCGADGKGNGLDDDCDGSVDEWCTCTPGVKELCGTQYAGKGPCKAGERTCLAGGVWGECLGAVLPVAEKCDTVDNDCDGEVNEDFNVGDPCSAGVGECKVNGTFVCKTDKSGTECSAQPKLPATESCNDKDDNCNGVKDDGQLCTDGQSCTAGTCVCPTGTTLCGQNCRALQEDEANCGGCTTQSASFACDAGKVCTAGVCGTPPLCESGTVRVRYTIPTEKSGLLKVRDSSPSGIASCISTTVTTSIDCPGMVLKQDPDSGKQYVQVDDDVNSDGIMVYPADIWGCNFWQGVGRIDGTLQAWKCNAGVETAATVTPVSIYGGGNCEIK